MRRAIMISFFVVALGVHEASAESQGEGAYIPKPGDKWAVIYYKDFAKRMKYEALPEALLVKRNEELIRIYEMSYTAYRKKRSEGEKAQKPNKPRIKIYRKSITSRESAENLAFERNKRMRKTGKQ